MPSKAEIVSDLATFSDLGTGPTILEDVANHLRVSWTCNGITRIIQVGGVTSANPTVIVDDGMPMGYREFLASPFMADLSRLARKITLLRGVFRTRFARSLSDGTIVHPTEWFVDPRVGPSAGANSIDSGAAQEHLQRFANGNSDDTTRILFVMAEAGQGKSRVLEEFTVLQAVRYERRETDTLALYVDAQGRGLARLDEVIAKQLNELQFLLGYNALVTLVREDLLVLVIDGFDELIGGRGTYDDAFRSLNAFLEVLDGRGSLIAAGRSTYFIQEYDARARLLSENNRYSIEQVFLKKWTQHDQDRFVEVALGSLRFPEARKSAVRRTFSEFQEDEQIRDLLGRPLFARDVLFILLDGGSKPADLRADRLVTYLASQYLKRETELKLRTADGPFLQPEQLAEYYQQLAEEMWDLETRELDVVDAETIMDTWADAAWQLTTHEREIARDRAAKLPFLATGELARRVRFEHEVFFGYFLAKSLIPALDGSSMAISLLGRGRLDPMTAESVIVQLTSASPAPSVKFQNILSTLGQLSKTKHPRRAQIELNAGALAAAVLRLAANSNVCANLNILDVTLTGEDLSGITMQGCRFTRVRFDRVDLRGANLVDCRADGFRLEGILLDRHSTRLDVKGLDVVGDIHGLQFEDETGLLDLTFDPAVVTSFLTEVGLAASAPTGPRFQVRRDVIDKVIRIARAFRHLNPVGTNHNRYGSDFTDALGARVVRILLDGGLLELDATPRQTRGPAQVFYRKRFDESALMAALEAPARDAAIETAWKALSSL